MSPRTEGTDMMRKSKKTDLASTSGASNESRALATRAPADWFAEVDRWFDDLRTEFEQKCWGPAASFGQVEFLAARQPPVDLADHGDEFLLSAELPGVKKEDLDLRVTPEGIEIAAESHGDKVETGKDYAYHERAYSSFRRVLPFPDPVVPDQVKAKLTDGVLEVRLPKVEPNAMQEPVKIRVE